MRLLKTLAVVSLLVLLPIAGLIGWLSLAPLPLDFAKARIESALPEVGPGLTWQISGADVTWGGWHRGIRLRARGVRLFEDNGAPILSLPAFGLHLAIAPLLRGELRVRWIDVRGPKVFLRRSRDDGVSLGVSSKKQQPNESAPETTARAVQEFLSAGANAWLKRIVVSNAEITVEDQKLGGSWFGRGGELELTRRTGGIDARLSMLLGSPQQPLALQAHGSVATAGDHRIDLTFNVDQLSLRELATLWPTSLAKPARQWITANITDGRVFGLQGEAQAHLLSSEDPPRLAPAVDRLEGAFRLEGAQVRFVDTMPPVTGLRARSEFTLDGFAFEVESGKLQAIAVGPAQVRITGLARDQPRLAINAAANGAVGDAIALLESPPVRLASKMSVDPVQVGGGFRSQVGFDFPLQRRIDSSRLGMNISARITELSLPKAVNEWDVAGGDLEISVNDREVHLWGLARLQGVPVKADWREILADDSELQRTITASATLDDERRQALGVEIADLRGSTPVEIELTQQRGRAGEIKIRSDLSEAHTERPILGMKKAAGVPGSLETTLSFSGRQIDAVKTMAVRSEAANIDATARRDQRGWRTIKVDGKIHDVPFTFDLAPGEPRDSFRLQSSDASGFLKVLGVYEDGKDGELALAGEIAATEANRPFDATLAIRGLTVRKAPVLARVLGLASFKGIESLVTGKGIKFKKIDARLSGDSGKIEIDDGTAVGSTLAIALEGEINRSAADLDLRGTIIPDSYGINRLLGTELLAVSFTMKGAFENPQVSIDPLGTLAPKVIKKMAKALQESGKSD